MSEKLEAILYGFLQAIAFGDKSIGSTEPNFESVRDKLSLHRTLKAESVLGWSKSERKALIELLKYWLMVLKFGGHAGLPLPIPESWISGSSGTRLNEKIVREILDRFDALLELHPKNAKDPGDRQD